MNELLKNAIPIGLIVSVPSLMALIGILFNQQGLAKADARVAAMERRMDDMGGKIDRLVSELSGKVDRLNSELSGKVDRLNSELSGKVDRLRDTLHSDVQQLLSMDAQKDVRIARLEERPS